MNSIISESDLEFRLYSLGDGLKEFCVHKGTRSRLWYHKLIWNGREDLKKSLFSSLCIHFLLVLSYKVVDLKTYAIFCWSFITVSYLINCFISQFIARRILQHTIWIISTSDYLHGAYGNPCRALQYSKGNLYHDFNKLHMTPKRQNNPGLSW